MDLAQNQLIINNILYTQQIYEFDAKLNPMYNQQTKGQKVNKPFNNLGCGKKMSEVQFSP